MNSAIAYCLQLLLLIAAGAFLPFLFRISVPKVRLWYWQGLLAACLLLPLVEPRQTSSVDLTTQDGPMLSGRPLPLAPVPRLDWGRVVFLGYATGVGLRVAWLLLGCWRLRRYRRNAIDLYPVSPLLVEAQKRLAMDPDIRLSSETASPLTFGILQPIVLLPVSFLELDAESQQAIAVHELLHVKRGDWAFNIAEEIVRSIFWFHPAIWWLLSQIQLTREQVVDRATVEFTQSRQQYLEALLAVAKTQVLPDLALAPLFLKKRHLAKRVAAVMKESHMSKRRIMSSLATVFALAFVAARVSIFVFPMESSAQDGTSAQSSLVGVEMPGHKLLHGTPITYPPFLLEKRIEGTVVFDLSVDGKGEVKNMNAVSGPDQLRSWVARSIYDWHFLNESGQPETIQVTVRFKAGPVAPPLPETEIRPGAIRSIGVFQVSDEIGNAVMQHLPLHQGDLLTTQSLKQATDALHEFDQHLSLRFSPTGASDGSYAVMILPAGAGAESSSAPSPFNPPSTPGVRRIRVGGQVMAAKQLNKVNPDYPGVAKQARIQGTVRFNVLIGPQGDIKALELVAGHPLLVPGSMQAVRQWTYQPTLLNGDAVEVATTIDVNYTLMP